MNESVLADINNEEELAANLLAIEELLLNEYREARTEIREYHRDKVHDRIMSLYIGGYFAQAFARIRLGR